MSMPSETRLQLGVSREVVKEFLVIKERVAGIEKGRIGHFSRVDFNNAVVAAGLKALKKKYKLILSPEERDQRFKKMSRRKRKKEGLYNE